MEHSPDMFYRTSPNLGIASCIWNPIFYDRVFSKARNCPYPEAD